MISTGAVAKTSRALALTLIGLLVACLALALWVGVRGVLAYQHLSVVQSQSSQVISALSTNRQEAERTLQALSDEAAAARELTADPLWALAEHAPWLGPQLAAFGAVTEATDLMLNESLLPLLDATSSVSADSFAPVAGRFDVSGLAEVAEPASVAAASAKRAAQLISDVNTAPLLGVVRRSLSGVGSYFDDTATLVDTLARASRLLPTMMSSDEIRNYLVLVQNNAEWRSLGGISGSAVLLRVDHGQMTLESTESATAISQGISQPITDLPQQLVDIYGQKPALFFHNLTQIPDFAIDGALASKFFETRTGVKVDGVLAIDPVVLSYMLGATGQVPLPTGDTLSSDNAIELLTNEVYKKYSDPGEQDAFFSAATAAVFQKLLTSDDQSGKIIAALGRAANERRILIWSAHASEQDVLRGTTLAGGIPASDDRTERIGVYLNDGTGSKMSYYVKPEVTLGWGQCDDAGAATPERSLELQLTFSNLAPADAAVSLPGYITGGGAQGVPPGTARVVGNIYVPNELLGVSTTSTTGSTFLENEYGSFRVFTFAVDLQPQTTATVKLSALLSSGANEVQAAVTPTADRSVSPTVSATCGSAATGAVLQ